MKLFELAGPSKRLTLFHVWPFQLRMQEYSSMTAKSSVANKPIAGRWTQSCGCQHIPPGAYCFPGYWITEQVGQGTGRTTPLQRVNDLCVMFSDPGDREETMAIRPVSLSPITILVNQNENVVTEYILLRSHTQ